MSNALQISITNVAIIDYITYTYTHSYPYTHRCMYVNYYIHYYFASPFGNFKLTIKKLVGKWKTFGSYNRHLNQQYYHWKMSHQADAYNRNALYTHLLLTKKDMTFSQKENALAV